MAGINNPRHYLAEALDNYLWSLHNYKVITLDTKSYIVRRVFVNNL